MSKLHTCKHSCKHRCISIFRHIYIYAIAKALKTYEIHGRLKTNVILGFYRTNICQHRTHGLVEDVLQMQFRHACFQITFAYTLIYILVCLSVQASTNTCKHTCKYLLHDISMVLPQENNTFDVTHSYLYLHAHAYED